jgi:hypothetical protein
MRTKLLALPAVAVLLAGCATMHQAAGSIGLTPVNSVTLHQDMRRLWADHVNWTRGYIIAATSGSQSAPVVLNRLMRNQEDIGNAIKPFYGDAAGAKLTDLLKQHIAIAGELVAAAKAGDATKQADADRRWHDNAADIASFLANANPKNWTRDGLLEMLNNHLALTTREAVDRLKMNWTDDVPNFDNIFTQAMQMADALADGIVKQFPTKA